MPDDRSLGDDPSRKLERTDLPPTETQQPDPLLQITTGRVNAGGITIAAVVVAVIVGVVFYGLNSRTESTVAPPSTTAAHQPAAGGASGSPTPDAPRANASGVKG
jgi:negative regulator of sigma E activity